MDKSIDLINKGANVNEKIADDGSFITPLIMAASIGSTQLTKCLLSKGADPTIKDFLNRNALMYASAKGNEGVVELLAKYNSHINDKDDEGSTALILGAKSLDLKIVKSLVNAGSDINAQDKLGITALMWSSLLSYNQDKIDLINFLLDNKANILIKDSHGRTAKDYIKDSNLKNYPGFTNLYKRLSGVSM